MVTPWMECGDIRSHISRMLDDTDPSQSPELYNYVYQQTHCWVSYRFADCVHILSSNIVQLQQICCGLKYLHEANIIHGDLRGVGVEAI